MEVEQHTLAKKRNELELLVDAAKEKIIRQRTKSLKAKLDEVYKWMETEKFPQQGIDEFYGGVNNAISKSKKHYVSDKEDSISGSEYFEEAKNIYANLKDLYSREHYYRSILEASAKLVSDLRDTDEEYKITFNLELKRVERLQAKPPMKTVSITLPANADVTIVWKNTNDPDNPFKINIPDEYITEELASFLEEMNDSGISFKYFTVSISYGK